MSLCASGGGCIRVCECDLSDVRTVYTYVLYVHTYIE